MNDERLQTIRPLLAILVLLAVVAALKATAAVTMPVALAIFTVILAWPLQRLLERKQVPRTLAYCITLGAILFIFACFIGLLYLCVQSVAAKAPEYEDQFAAVYEQARVWVEDRGPESARKGNDESATTGPIIEALRTAVIWSYGLMGLFTLTITFLVLGLIEVHRVREKLSGSMQPKASTVFREAGREVSTTLQRYMLVRTVVSATTGIVVGLYTWGIGLDFPIVWGVSSFLLNYIPVLGSIVAVIPPSAFALLHPEPWVFFAALGGLTLIQFTIGNFIDPRLEGKVLSLSPFILFFSIAFWGWVWSIPGALMGIPITATIVIFCRKYEASRWLATLLTR
jgi:predicted PurR-regulated permease PerM